MHTVNGEHQEGDTLALRVLEGISESELLQMLKTEGIEIVIVEIKEGFARIAIRIPKRMLVVFE